MDIRQLEREVNWYTEEVAARKRDLVTAEQNVVKFRQSVAENTSKLEGYKRQLAAEKSAEEAARNKKAA